MNELLLIIIGCLCVGVGIYIQDWRRKKKEEKFNNRIRRGY